MLKQSTIVPENILSLVEENFFFNPRHLPKCLCIKSSQVVEEFELKGKLTRKRTTWQYYFYLLPTNNSSWQLS